MSSVASLTSQSAVQPNAHTIDNQIKSLEKRISDGVSNGTITASQGKALTKALDEVKKAVDSGGSTAGLSGADMRKISQTLRDIGRQIAGAAPNGSSQSASNGTDSDGDYDNSGVSATA